MNVYFKSIMDGQASNFEKIFGFRKFMQFENNKNSYLTTPVTCGNTHIRLKIIQSCEKCIELYFRGTGHFGLWGRS